MPLKLRDQKDNAKERIQSFPISYPQNQKERSTYIYKLTTAYERNTWSFTFLIGREIKKNL